jgi:glycosyltransferase involved in cell wall biosynthesis
VPAVSVVIPAYNAEGTIAETLASLLAQTFTDFEALVIDDGSADRTAEVAGGTGDPRVRVLGIPNGGVAHARNQAISQAHGDLIAFLDADDLWEPRKLELQVAALERQPEAGWCVTGGVRIDESSNEIGPLPLLTSSDVCRTLLLRSMTVGHLSSGMVRKTILDQAGGFDARFSQCADWDLWLRLSVTAPVAVLSDRLLRYRTTAGNMSSNISLLERDTFAVLDSFFGTAAAAPYRPARKQVYGAHWMVCAGSYLHRGQTREALRCVLRGVIAYPGSLARVLGIPWRRVRGAAAGPGAAA